MITICYFKKTDEKNENRFLLIVICKDCKG